MLLLSSTVGIITSVSLTKTKKDKPMLIISYTQGNSDTLKKLFLFEGDENFDALKEEKDNLIGTKIASKLELI